MTESASLSGKRVAILVEDEFEDRELTGPLDALPEIPIPEAKAGAWQVEADFVEAIRGGERPRLTDFETGVAYMEFTEAVHISSREGRRVYLPLA